MGLRIVPILIAACTSFTSLAGEERWAFTPPPDAFAADAMLDLRGLNEPIAGASGFVRLSPDGNEFVLGNGKPARFWAANAGLGPGTPEEMARTARFFAKRGINMARIFGQISPDMGKDPHASITDANHAVIDHIWRFEAALKKEGIYSVISPFWVCSLPNPLPSSWGFAGDPQPGYGYLFFNRHFQDAYKSWMKALYAETNPYTGIPLAKDPAVAVIQLQNEDSMLFWTFMNVFAGQGQAFQELSSQFGAWAAKKYGSLAAAKAAWKGESANGDDPAHGRLGFYQMWEITNQPSGAKGDRMADQVLFVAETMYHFNQMMDTYLHQELGCRQLINAGNWRTADTVKLQDLEHWSYTANQVMDTHYYVGGVHVGPDAGWAIDVGDHYTNLSCILDPRSMPLNIKQVVGHPFIESESSWTIPDLYQSEGPAMVAAYSALTGFGAFFWNGGGGGAPGWDGAKFPWGPKAAKWAMQNPMGLGQFPAAAVMYRRDDVRRGAVAVHEERPLDDLAHERTPLIAEEKAFDPNRDQEKIPSRSTVRTSVNPLAFLVGRVEVVLGAKADPARNRIADLDRYIDSRKHEISSITGQIHLNWGTGLFTVDTPKAQVAAGMLGRNPPVALSEVSIACQNPYATIMVVSLDDAPLSSSGKVLVQIGTTCRTTGWKDHPASFTVDKQELQGFQVDDAGDNPWAVEKAQGVVTIHNARLRVATILDPNGMAAGRAEGHADHGSFLLTLPSDALYVVLTAR